MPVKGKKVLVGISGGIAAYKICELVRLFKKDEAEVRVVMTPSAANFVSPTTLSALSGNEVLINIFPQTDPSKTETVETKTWHIYTGMWADVFIIAPATANTIAKIVDLVVQSQAVPIPLDAEQVKNLQQKPSFFGISAGTEPQGLRVKTLVPVEQMQGIARIANFVQQTMGGAGGEN